MDLAHRLGLAWPRKFKTRSEFAAAANISPQYISGLLKGKGAPSPEFEQRIARALGITRSDLVTEDDERFLAALDANDPTAPDPEHRDDVPTSSAGEARAGLVRSFPVRSAVYASGAVRGEAGFLGASGYRAKLAQRFKTEAGARAGADVRRHVGLVGVPEGAMVAELAEPLEIRGRDGEILAKYRAGWLLIVEPDAKPRGLDLELVIAKNDRDVELGQAKVSIMRYARSSEGDDLLYPLDGGKPRTTAENWDIVAVIDGEPRTPRPLPEAG